MRVPNYVRRALHAWTAWRARQRLYAAVPELRVLDQRQASISRHHKAGARSIAKQKRKVMTARLQMEIGVRHG